MPEAEVTRDTGTSLPRGDAYDVVVIGAGIGGLTAGALLANAGKRVSSSRPTSSRAATREPGATGRTSSIVPII